MSQPKNVTPMQIFLGHFRETTSETPHKISQYNEQALINGEEVIHMDDNLKSFFMGNITDL